MRYNEFKRDEEELRFIKFTFEKVLKALKARYIKKIKRLKNRQKAAKQQMRTRKLRSNRNDLDVPSTIERPKR